MVRRFVLVALVAAGLGSVLAQAQEPPDAGPALGPAPTTDQVRQWFPQTRGWFRLVETMQFARSSDGRLSPIWSTLTHRRVRPADGAGRTLLPWFAPRFAGPMRLQSGPTHTTTIEVVPLEARDVAARIERGVVVYPGAYPDTDVLYKATPTHTDEYLLLRTPRAPRRWRFQIVRNEGAQRVRQAGNSIEIANQRGAAMMRATPPIAVDRTGRRVTGTIRVVRGVIVAEIPTRGLSYPILVDPDWASTGDMSAGRFYHGFNVLPDGRVLATGGCSSSVCSGDLSLPICPGVVQSAEALDVETRTFSRVAESSYPRFFHVAETLESGEVLVAGGCVTPDCNATTWAPEIFSATTNRFRALDDPGGLARAGLATVRLPTGRVLLAGGCTLDGCETRTDIFDPSTGRFTAAAPMHRARGRAPAVVLADGRVLVAGGCTDIACTSTLADSEVYDPSANTWTESAPMSSPRGGHFAVRLGGRVLVGGGCATQRCEVVLSSAEIFEPGSLRFTPTGSMTQGRVGAVGVGLPDGNILINQGCTGRNVCDLTNERYDRIRGTFARVEPAITTRAFHVTVLHPAGLVIANGGCQPTTCSWWNETWDIGSLVPIDAGVFCPLDAGTRDAGIGPERCDAGPRPTYTPPADCGCRTAASTGPPPALAVLAALALIAPLVRRRRT